MKTSTSTDVDDEKFIEMDSENELSEKSTNNDSTTKDKNRDIYKKKDQPYRKQYCTYDNCDAYFYVNWHLERHLRKHAGETPFICDKDDCDKAFTCRAYLNKHIKQVHETDKKPAKVRKTYPCSECGHVFKQKYNLKAHMYIHTGQKPFQCDQCDKSFTNASKLRKHSKTHKGYKCNRENCDFVANLWTGLQKHVAQNHKEIFNCEICDKKFNERYALTSHMKIHSGEKLSCTYENCNKIYTNNRNLKAHIRIHHEGKRFECDYENCEEKFRYKSSLTKHINRVHSDQPIIQKTNKSTIYTHRVSYAQKLTGVECCEQELKAILLQDKVYREAQVV